MLQETSEGETLQLRPSPALDGSCRPSTSPDEKHGPSEQLAAEVILLRSFQLT